MEKLATCDADLVFTNECVHYFDGDKEIGTEVQPCSNIYDKPIQICSQRIDEILTHCTCINFRKCTYKTSILQQQYPLFREKVSYDDTILYVAPYPYAKSLIAYDFTLYNLLRGREEQSMNPRVMQAKAEQSVQAYLDMHEYIKKNEFHTNTLGVVSEVELATFSHRICVVSYTEYRRRKNLIQILKNNQPSRRDYSKQIKRYMHIPFVIAYLWDNLRHMIHTKK